VLSTCRRLFFNAWLSAHRASAGGCVPSFIAVSPWHSVLVGACSPIRLCLKGFLLGSKVMGGLSREAATPGSLKEPAPWVPWASRLGSLGLQSLVPRPKSQNPKNCFGAFDCQKIAFGVLSFSKIAFGVLNCRKCFGILSCHKIARAF